MEIFNTIHLFYFNNITDIRSGIEPRRPLFSFFDRAEGKGNAYLEEARYWLKGKRMTLFTNEVIVEPNNKNYNSLISKIQSIAKAILYFIPGILIKSFVWTFDFSYVNQRNRRVTELLKRASSFTRQCDLRPHFFQPEQFAQPAIEQRQSNFNNIPHDIQFFEILPFLKDRDLGALAQTCKQNHKLVFDFSADEIFQLRDYPPFIVEALGK